MRGSRALSWLRQRLRLGLLLGVTSLLAAGCAQVTAEVWINPDGSGRYRLDVAVAIDASGKSADPEAEKETLTGLSPEVMNRMVAEDANLKKIESKQHEEPGWRHYVTDLEVQDVYQLHKTLIAITAMTQSPEDDPDPLKVSVVRQANGNALFLFDIALERTGTPSRRTDLSGWVVTMRRQIGDSPLKVIVHAPKIVSTNGTLDQSGTSARWSYLLADAFSETMRFGSFKQELRAEAILSAPQAVTQGKERAVEEEVAEAADVVVPARGRGREPITATGWVMMAVGTLVAGGISGLGSARLLAARRGP